MTTPTPEPAVVPGPALPPLPPPPPLASRWVRAMLGLGVAAVVGLAPFLGATQIPGFSALVEMVPRTDRRTAHIVAAAIMGAVATAVQWYGDERLSAAWLRRSFRRSLALFGAGLLALFLIGSWVVVPVEVTGAGTTETYVVGFGERPDRRPCLRAAGLSDAECIRDSLTLDPARVAGFWGDRTIRRSRIALLLPYLVTTGAFGLMVGLLILRQSQPKPARRRAPRAEAAA